MVDTIILLRVLNSHHILYILHHTYRGTVAVTVGTDRTDISVADVVADTTMTDISTHMCNGIGKGFDIVLWLSQKMQHEAERRLAPHPG